jgi:hypothetical protein
MLQRLLAALFVTAGALLPASAPAQTEWPSTRDSDEILRSLESNEKLTWQSPRKGGPCADFSLDAADSLAAPEPPVEGGAAAFLARDSDYGPKSGSVELTLAGSGVSDKHFHNSAATVTGSLGLVKSGHSENAAASRGAIDFHIPLGVVQPFVGVNLGYVYGRLVRNTWEGAPEAGLKIFVKRDVFIYGLGEYRIFFKNSHDIDQSFRDGEWFYSVGIGVLF